MNDAFDRHKPNGKHKKIKMPSTTIEVDIVDVVNLGNGDYQITIHYTGPVNIPANIEEGEKLNIEVPSHRPPGG